jgi:hypothetical protein
VRELANLIERAMILSRVRTLEVPLDDIVRRRPGAGALGNEGAADPDAERTTVLRALEQANWVLAGPRGAAARLGMKRTTLQSLMKRLDRQTRLARSPFVVASIGPSGRVSDGLPNGSACLKVEHEIPRSSLPYRAVVGISLGRVT